MICVIKKEKRERGLRCHGLTKMDVLAIVAGKTLEQLGKLKNNSE